MVSEVDAVLLEVLRNELSAITEEVAISIEKTGRSPVLRSGDFATALADRHGRVTGWHSDPHFVNLFTCVLGAILERWRDELAPGDVVVSNDPYLGGSHKPDVFVVMPVFHGGAVAGFVMAYSHHTDVGGRFAGGLSSRALSSYEEGIHLPAVKLYEGGVRNEAVAEVLAANIRAGEEFLDDIEAKRAGCWRGARELEAVFEKYGAASVEASFDRMLDFAESEVRQGIAQLPDGTYSCELAFREDGLGTTDVEFPIVVGITITGDELRVDFAGSADQVAGGINIPLENTRGFVFSALYWLLGIDAPFNAGFMRAITIDVPKGSFLNPRFPAAVGGRAALLFLLRETIFRAMAQAAPDRVPVPPSGPDAVMFAGRRDDGSQYSAMDLIHGSWGARPTLDAVDGAATIFYSGIAVEIIEREFPVVVEELDLVPDSAGAGRFRGGLSVRKQYYFRGDADVMIRTNRHTVYSYGLDGGQQGGMPVSILTAADGTRTTMEEESHVHVQVHAGDRLVHESGATGGHGRPELRDRHRLEADVAAGHLTPEGIRKIYGISLDVESSVPSSR